MLHILLIFILTLSSAFAIENQKLLRKGSESSLRPWEKSQTLELLVEHINQIYEQEIVSNVQNTTEACTISERSPERSPGIYIEREMMWPDGQTFEIFFDEEKCMERDEYGDNLCAYKWGDDINVTVNRVKDILVWKDALFHFDMSITASNGCGRSVVIPPQIYFSCPFCFTRGIPQFCMVELVKPEVTLKFPLMGCPYLADYVYNFDHIFSNLEKLIMPAKLEISFNFTAYWRPGVRAETLAFDIIAVRGEKFSSKQSTMQA